MKRLRAGTLHHSGRLAVVLLAAGGMMLAQEISHTTPPAVVHKVDPEYTTEALAAKLEGTVLLSTVIDVNGIPSEIKLTRGIGMGLDEKAVECLERWRFKAATRFGEPIPAKATVEIRFRLPQPVP